MADQKVKAQKPEGQKKPLGHGVQLVTITEKNETQRIDNFLLSACKGVPKSKIYRVIRKGDVRINKKRCKPETKLQLGDIVRVPPMHTTNSVNGQVKVSDSLSQALKDSVLYEDDQLLVINKPSGLAVHGGSGVNLGLIEALRTKYPEHQFLELVHRLDRDTSGAVLIAKSRPALKALHAQFRDDTVNKIYHLAVFGKWPKYKVMVDAPLRKNELKSGERMVVVSADGKPSQTKFSILNRSDKFTLVEAKPITGRTHQIRVHAAFSKHPIVGDVKYIQNLVEDQGGMEKARLMLHARAIEFDLPIKGGKTQRMRLEAEYDERYMQALEKMELL
ncbi:MULTISPECIES: RluA family pseudouridine synthase [unclassified Oleiphilus]|uniref:RluA family pseudouridine synthase n=1 Tax=unclassified Oleiphilus TaxID=2631174 RepID=UPI000A62C743|nr:MULTISPECIES: RluA family pseudouridine synthase [unclassified Oleiphilus]